MKKIVFILVLLVTFSGYSQAFQGQAPWMKSNEINKNKKLTLEEISKSAEAFFKTIDRNKKGSGLKPFERWRYHWNFYTKPDGTIAPASDLWKAWRAKNNMNSRSTTADESNWSSIGPFTHTNTASWSSGQGRVNTFTIDPNNVNTLYVGAPAGGIWKSTDGGTNWTPLVDHLPQIGVSAIAVDKNNSNIIYIGTGDDDASDSYSVGVWKSTDGGTTWANTGDLTGLPNSINEIYIYPNNSNNIIASTSNGIHKSADGGATWTRKLAGPFKGLKMKPGNPNIWYAVSRSNFYKSTDSGETFSLISITGLTNSSRLVIDVTPANSEYIYISSADSSNNFNGVFKSTNGGATFVKTAETDDIFGSRQAWYDFALTVSDTNPDVLFIGVLNIWKSNNGGDNFTKLNNWSSPNDVNYTHGDIHFLRFIDGGFYAGTDGGIYKSENHGNSFSSLTQTLAISQFYKISVATQNSSNVVGGLQDNGGFAYKDNNWNNYHGADGMDCAVSGSLPDTYFGFIQFGGALYRTDDGGLTRSNGVSAPNAETGAGDDGGNWVTPLVSDKSGNIYSGYSQLYKLVSGSWTKISNHSFGGDISNIEIDNININNIYVSRGGNLFRSTNSGVNFTTLSFSGGVINGIEISNSDSNIVWVVTNSGVYKSTNILSASPTFTNISSNLPSESKLVIKHHKRSGNNTIYVGTTLGVYSLNENSSDWTVFDNSLPNVAIRDLEINETDSKIYAGTYGRGVFVSNLPVILPDNDIGLISINEPNSSISCSDVITPKITVKNLGLQNINSVTINYNLDGGANNSFVWNGTIASEATQEIVFPDITLEIGKHTFNVNTVIDNDTYNDNNDASLDVIINKSNSTPTTINSFENTTDALLIETLGSFGNNLWERGVPNDALLNSSSTGTKAYATSLSTNYSNNTISYLYTNCYNLSLITNPVLKFQMGFDIENEWDYLIMEYSTDTGANWGVLGNASDPNWYTSAATTNSTGQANLPGKQWTGLGESNNPQGGTNATLHEYSYDLAAFTNETNIIFRFKFYADDNTNEEGVVIDDLVISGTLSVNNETLQNTISVYPNPSEDLFNISWGSQEKANISVYNYLGQLVLEKKNVSTNFNVNLRNKSKGLYFVKILIDGKQATKKLILR